MRAYHVFFTTQYTQVCLEQCCFGASVSNSLANIKCGDIAFLFDGLKRKLFGPLEIVSDQQYVDVRPIYGMDKRGNTRYKNRVWFKTGNAKETLIVKIYSTERDPFKPSFLLNRHIISTLIANKQVNATPLTNTEGQYLTEKCIALGKNIRCPCPNIPPNIEPVFPALVFRRPISEAWVEVLILNKKCRGYLIESLNTFTNQASCYNQFVVGFQRQIDLLIDDQDKLALIEIKRANNLQNPYEQIIEYLYYCLSSFRLHYSRSSSIKSIVLVALIENGSIYLANDLINKFQKRCVKISFKENIEIEPHIIIYNVSPDGLETEPFVK